MHTSNNATSSRLPKKGACWLDLEQESNPVGVRAQFETPLPQSLPQSSGVTGSLPTLALVYMLGQLQRIQPDALDAPDFVGIGAKPTRQDGQRGRRNGGG